MEDRMYLHGRRQAKLDSRLGDNFDDLKGTKSLVVQFV
jgi:hypothetical protein